MVNPVTVNAGIIVPLTGADVDLWGANDVNPNMVAIDGLLCGVQTVAVSNIPVTLTAPAGFIATPSPGPKQSQNRVLRFTGVLTADVTVTLPLPGVYVIANLTTGNFVLSFRGATATGVIGTPQGEQLEIYNDGANVQFVNLARMGSMDLWAGLNAMPSWVAACTVPPYLLCNGAVYNFSDFPALGNRLGGAFGGNGITTFGVPDLRGRVPLAYDGSGARITTAGCGLNGQTIGASIDTQTVAITVGQLPGGINSANAVQGISVNNTGTVGFPIIPVAAGGTGPISQGDSGSFTTASGRIPFASNASPGSSGIWSQTGALSGTNSISVTSSNTGAAGNGAGAAAGHPNVQPSLVVGIWAIKT